MEMCLTGRMMDAEEADRTGLVSRIVPSAMLVEEAVKVGERIASMSRPVAMMAKEAVNRAYETTLAEGVLFERRLFHSTFATADRGEGMVAFVEKREPDFKHPLGRATCRERMLTSLMIPVVSVELEKKKKGKHDK